MPLGVITGVPGVTWEKFIFSNLIPGEQGWLGGWKMSWLGAVWLLCAQMVRMPSAQAPATQPALSSFASPCPTHPPAPAVTLGNIVAGALCMATVYSLAYGSLGKKVWKQ